jgi:glycosyltransferase involved in cell wall biosynthesis
VKIAFVTNICSHYRVKTFETLARYHHVDYYFFSVGDEWYWQQQHGVAQGDFHHEYLWSFQVGGTRITPTLPLKLWRGGYDAYVKCINGRFALPFTYLVARIRRKPFLLWTGIWHRLGSPVHRLFFPLTRYIYRHADAVVVYGTHVRDYLIAEGVDRTRIFVADHAVDNSSYNQPIPPTEIQKLRDSLGLESAQKVVLYLGRLEPGKGLAYTLRAFALQNDPDVVLLIAGDGSLRCSLEQLAVDLGIAERVRFTGYIAAEQTPQYYALAYVGVLASTTLPLFKEPWGLVVNEAFNQGVPMITSDSVGAAAGGLVRDNDTGLVVPERDVAAMAGALRRILADPDLRDRLGRRAAAEISKRNNERMVAGFRAAIDFCVGKA